MLWLRFLNLQTIPSGVDVCGKILFFFFLLNKNGCWQLSLWWRLYWRSLWLWSVLWCRDCPVRGFVFIPSPASWDPVTVVDPRSFLLQLQKCRNTCLKLQEHFVLLRNFFLNFLFTFINFYWSMVALQCCASFCCTARWISHMYLYIPCFLDFLPIQVTTALSRAPRTIQ